MAPGWLDRVLVLAPHVDDETIGCGALLASLGSRAVVRVFGTSDYAPLVGDPITQPQRLAEFAAAMDLLGVEDYGVLYEGAERNLAGIGRTALVTRLDALLAEVRPTAVFTALPSHHQDHTEAFQATLSALRMRPSLYGLRAVLTYEYPHADLFPGAHPESGFVYFDGSAFVDQKRAALRAHASQLTPHPDRWLDSVLVLRWGEKRGIEAGTAFAEKFYLLRFCF